MNRGTLRSRWRTEVWRSPLIPDSVRVVCLLLGEHMEESGKVSVPRSSIANAIGRSPQRVTERINVAVDVGLLARVSAGKPGRTAVYSALLPNRKGPHVRTTARGPDHRPLRGPDVRTTKPWDKGPDGGVASSSAVVDEVRQPQHLNGHSQSASEQTDDELASESSSTTGWGAP